MNCTDEFMTALCIWREARGVEGDGMIAVGCVIRNRARKHETTFYQEVVKSLQFSSITAKGDPQLTNFPKETDSQFISAQHITSQLQTLDYADITGGATLYYDDSIEFPSTWNRNAVVPTVKIGRLNFYKEL